MLHLLESKKISLYLINKIRGGEVNQRGNIYEQFYACNLICLFAKNHPLHLNDIIISSQQPVFVDDLYISFKEKKHYYQLKTSANLNWNYRKKFSSLKIDFWLQHIWCRWNKEDYELYLVISNKEVYKNMILSKPKSIPNLHILEFPYKETISLLLSVSTPFRKNIASMCALENPSLDKLAAVAANIIGVWLSSSKKNLTLNALLRKAKEINGAFVKYPLSELPILLSFNLQIILQSITSFKYYIDSDYFIWEYGTLDSGNLPYTVSSAEFETFEQKVIQANPVAFEELEKYLN